AVAPAEAPRQRAGAARGGGRRRDKTAAAVRWCNAAARRSDAPGVEAAAGDEGPVELARAGAGGGEAEFDEFGREQRVAVALRGQPALDDVGQGLVALGDVFADGAEIPRLGDALAQRGPQIVAQRILARHET